MEVNGAGRYTVAATGTTTMVVQDSVIAEVGAYIDCVTGAAILVKSTSADITLDDMTVQSSSGVALLTALNSDSMSRYLKQDVGGGVNATVADSVIDGPDGLRRFYGERRD